MALIFNGVHDFFKILPTMKGFGSVPFGNKVLWFLLLFVTGWLFTKLLVLVWEKLILPMVSKTESSLDDHLAKNLHKPLVHLLSLGSVYLAAKVTIDVTEKAKSYITTFENIVFLILIWLLAMLINGIAKSLFDWYMEDIAPNTESTLDDTIFPILKKVAAVVVYFIAVTVILGQFKVNLTGFLATAGVASLALAFAAQETLSNVVAGVSLLMDRSFHIGERIELKDGMIGDVVEMGLRSTKILSLDQRLIIVPNKDIAGSRLINWNQPDAGTKVKLKIGVAVNEDLEKVKEIIRDVCKNIKELAKGTSPTILCTEFGPYYIEMLIIVAVKDCRNGGIALDQLVMDLQKRFQKEGIALPFPQQYLEVKKV